MKTQKLPTQTARRPSARTHRLALTDVPNKALPCVLITGFEAFGDDPGDLRLNPSALAAQVLHGTLIHGHTVVAAVLPCVFGQSQVVLKKLIRQHQPSMVVCTGQAGGRAGISIERVAVNLDDAALADNAGVVLRGSPVAANGPAAYFSSLPVHSMLAALEHAGLACELSSSAGHFVCNHVFYALMHSLAKSKLRRGVPAGFVHVPYLPEQASAGGAAHSSSVVPSMALQDITRGLRIALQAALAAH